MIRYQGGNYLQFHHALIAEQVHLIAACASCTWGAIVWSRLTSCCRTTLASSRSRWASSTSCWLMACLSCHVLLRLRCKLSRCLGWYRPLSWVHLYLLNMLQNRPTWRQVQSRSLTTLGTSSVLLLLLNIEMSLLLVIHMKWILRSHLYD